MATQTGKTQWHASYWNPQKHGSAWNRVKDALQRDWSQTKADVHAKTGKQLNQGLDDTVKQAVGAEPIPPAFDPNPKDFAKAEVALEYGFGAHEEYGQKYTDWNDELEKKLEAEWDFTRTGMSFKDAKEYVRRGWEYRS